LPHRLRNAAGMPLERVSRSVRKRLKTSSF
jgi:hypothetical protein